MTAGQGGWATTNASWRANWQSILQREIGTQNTTVDLKQFTRVMPQTTDNRLILDAPSLVDRRALLEALR